MLLSLTRQINQLKIKSLPLRGALLSSGVLAFSGLGDAILYPTLPAYADSLGLSAFWVGVILSINRLVRIIANTWIARLINRIGLKKILFISAFMAIVTTLTYGLGLGITFFVIARIIWGLSYSGLKQSNLNYAAHVEKNKGVIFGIIKSLNSLGVLAAFWIGPMIISEYGFNKGIIIIGFLSIPAVIIAYFLPQFNASYSNIKSKNIFNPSAVNLLIFILSVAIDGILAVVIAKLLYNPVLTTAQIVVIAGFYLLLKRLVLVVFSLISGFITVRFSSLKIFKMAIFCCIVSLAIIALGYIKTGMVIAFIFNATFVTLSPLIAISLSKRNQSEIIASTSTWWDFGAALGAFSGVLLIELLGYQLLFFSLSLITLLLFVNFILRYGSGH